MCVEHTHVSAHVMKESRTQGVAGTGITGNTLPGRGATLKPASSSTQPARHDCNDEPLNFHARTAARTAAPAGSVSHAAFARGPRRRVPGDAQDRDDDRECQLKAIHHPDSKAEASKRVVRRARSVRLVASAGQAGRSAGFESGQSVSSAGE